MLPLRESNRLRRFPFELDRFQRSGLVKNRHIFADAASESGNVLIPRSFPFARTVICAVFAFITKPSNLSRPVGLGFGFTALTMIAAAVSATMIGTVTGVCAAAGEENAPATESISGTPNPAILTMLIIPRRPWQSAVILEIARPG